MDSDLRRLERALRYGEDTVRLERARLRAGFAPAASLDDFIRQDSNAPAHDLVVAAAARRLDGHVFLDGPSGTGKTLLLRALYASRQDSWLWSGVDLHDRGARALERGELLDVPRLLIVDDLTSLAPGLVDLLRRSLAGRMLVAAGSAVRDACTSLGGRLAVVGALDEAGRRELFARVRRRLGPASKGDTTDMPADLPRSGFEIEGLARILSLRAST